jgi:hypothetical protein
MNYFRIYYLKSSDRKEVMRVRRRKNILFSLKFLVTGVAAIFGYYIVLKRYKLFKK